MRRQAEQMNSVYRIQSKFYDATRWLILVGRDLSIDRLSEFPSDASVLELGCGTARNLIAAARRHPKMRFYGVDLSEVMLSVACRKVRKYGYSQRIKLAVQSAEQARYDETFARSEGFDALILSFVLTMLPDERSVGEVLENAKRNLKPGGELIIVDYAGYRTYPRWFRSLMMAWHRTVHVVPSVAFVSHLEQWERQGLGSIYQRSVLGDASRIVVFTARK